ncbi:hypothetical protein [Myroides odoratus]|uniref:Uncharacterized protein n=1 Tax=Myroides odoratus TaxID=256 RepID=A0A9Q6ZF17_MYROD|nr:hypothetical protein [Myroides odoratus]EHQ42867.1 hypothetical protein Myrod_2036 [Myroides odoratus DSM 2801]EKB07445.1 hypothetical protein HMPREF9716_01895 [Myroides odoratus CIP 103059]QQU00220.1 hypothetical protein I6I88_00115 [Myroides odoratus]WQD57558.1 hypothetical protein U0010_18935 [Myroides odoratus]STZ30132.1 Uncharacterised protein [Myroides odoratus]
MKKTMLVLAMGGLLMFTSCSSDESTKSSSLDGNSKVEMNTNPIMDTTEFKDFENLYNQFTSGEIEMGEYLKGTESVDIAMKFLEKLGETTYGGYTYGPDIVSFALVQYFIVISN